MLVVKRGGGGQFRSVIVNRRGYQEFDRPRENTLMNADVRTVLLVSGRH